MTSGKLRHVTRTHLTIRRRRQGRGFTFVDSTGAVIRDEATRRRARALAIPPAWEDVAIAPDPQAHIQAMGRDSAGRTQYIYHEDWENERVARKQGHLSLLARSLPSIRRRVLRDLAAPTGSRELALAIAVALIDRTAIRAGGERYFKTAGTRGASTLLRRDVRRTSRQVTLDFEAKGGKRATYQVNDRRLAAAIGRIKHLTGRRLLVYRDDAGELRPITSDMINAYIGEIAHAPLTAKDFRTFHASAIAADLLAEAEPPRSESARKRQLASVARQVAETLHNTPAISRKSYIAPCIFELFDDGSLKVLCRPNARRKGLRRREERLAALISEIEPIKRPGPAIP